MSTKDNFGLEGENQEKPKLWKGSQRHLVQLSHETGSVVAPDTRISHDRHGTSENSSNPKAQQLSR